MKKKLHLKLWSLVLILMTTVVNAQTTFSVDNIKYTVSSELTVTVSGYDSWPQGILTIPSTVTDAGISYAVTSIGNSAFYNCAGLTSVSIPNSITSIGNSAFYNCYGLKSLSIPASVTSIGESAFYNCYGLTSVSIPDSVTSIGNSVFYNCSRLTSLDIPNSVTSIGSRAFYNCAELTSLSIPDSVKSIGFYAFARCFRLTSLSIPDSVTSIGSGAFSDCFRLISVNIPNSVKSIGDYAFNNCSGLTSLSIPNSVTSIDQGAFSDCYRLTSLNVSWETPLVINNDVFMYLNLNNIALNVSSPGNLSDYQNAAVWKDFGSIKLNTPSYALDKNILVYPTLVKDFMAVSGLSQMVSYTIFSVLGLKAGNGSVSDNEKINVQNLANGVYILQFEGGLTTKFLKQ